MPKTYPVCKVHTGIFIYAQMNHALCACLITPTQNNLFEALVASYLSDWTTTTGKLVRFNRKYVPSIFPKDAMTYC